MSAEQNSLFFLGCERSGTTFVMQTLCRHYDVAPGNEPGWVVQAYRVWKKEQPKTEAEQRRFLRDVFSYWYFATKANYHNVIFREEDFIQSGGLDYRRFVREVFQSMARQLGKKYILNKTCMYCEAMSEVDEVFDRPRIVYIVRDGRDVALSLFEVKGWGAKTIYGAAKFWRRRVDAFDHYLEKSHAGCRVLKLRYEDLVENPAEKFEEMTRFYDIFDPTTHSRLVADLQMKQGNTFKWKHRLLPAQVRLFERCAGEALVRNGYELQMSEQAGIPIPSPMARWFDFKEWWASHIRCDAFYYKSIRVVHRVFGHFPELTRKLYRTRLFRQFFNWNKVSARFKKR